MRFSHAAVALSVGSAAAIPAWGGAWPGWGGAVPKFTIPALTLPTALPTFTFPTALPTFTLPTFTLPTFPGFPAPTTTAHPTTTSSPATSAPATSAPATSKPTSGASIPASSIGGTKPIVSVISTAPVKTSGVATGSGVVGTSSVGVKSSGVVGTSAVSVKSSGVVGTSPISLKSTGVVGTSSTGLKTSVPAVSASVSKPVISASSKAPSSKAPVSIGSSVSKKPSSTGVSTVSSPVPTAGIGAPVNTTSGVVTGHLAPNTSGVSEYLGIRFGQAPVGNLRFAAPVAYTSTAPIDGSNFGFDCPCVHENVPEALGPRLYNLLGDLAQINDTLGEDCLFLNVWSKPQTGPKVKPVLVWIYGGGFNFGGTNSLVYNPKHFVDDEDVVAVSINYRTNVFGFSGAPNQTQNTGLLDQRLAIEWVRDNIANFGGDPSRITIFGQSAGGASVDLYTFAYPNDPIIAGAIPMSGTSDSFGSRTLAQAQSSWDIVTTAVGCGNSSNTPAPQVLACMRQPNITSDAIAQAAAPGPGLGSLLGNFGPTVDDVVVFSSYSDRASAGLLAKIPTLTGNLNDESGLFILIAAGAGQGYPDSTWQYINEQVFTCAVSRAARRREANNIPIWRYYYGGAYPNLVLPTANLSQAWHTSEIPVLFGNSAQVSVTDDIPQETQFGDYIRSAWVTFATDPTNGLNTLGWPQYTSGNLIALGFDNATTASYSNASAIETPCSF